jgi:hypothetical protein
MARETDAMRPTANRFLGRTAQHGTPTANHSADPLPKFDRLANSVTPHLAGNAIANLSKTALRALAKLTGQQGSELDALVTAHKLAAQTGLPANVVFALHPEGGAPEAGFFASQTPADMRKTIASAVKKNVVAPSTLTDFEAARPGLTDLQTKKTPLASLVKTYRLGIPDALLRRLEAKKIETLADLRVAGDAAALAKLLKVKPDDKNLTTLVAHANLSLLGTDIATNAIAIKEGYTRIPAIAAAPADVFAARVGPTAGVATALRMHAIAAAQTALLRNTITELGVRAGNGLDVSQFPTGVVRAPTDTRCGCEDCSSAVSPLAYLADLIGYATEKLGTALAVGGNTLAPIYRLYDPATKDRFYTQSRRTRDDGEIAGYLYEETAFYLPRVTQPLAAQLYALQHPPGNAPDDITDHLLTTSATERTSAASLGYSDQETLGYIYETAGQGRIPLYRLVNDARRQHVFTTDPDEKNKFIAAGFRPESITGYVPKEAYDLLTAQDFETMFCQPFDALPTSCDLMNEQVRQVRICIEVVRAYCKESNIALPPAFQDKQAQYCSDTYQELLSKLGTSYAALRAVRGASADDRAALAAALGIPPGDGNQRDYLAELLLGADTVTETDIERLFGLADTARDPLSHGAKLDDTQNQVTRWKFENVSWNIDTDMDGCVFASLSRTGATTNLEVHRAPNGSAADLEASGQAGIANATIVLNPYVDNGQTDGLAGELDVAYVAAANDIKFQVVPQFTSWRLQTLRTQWQDQDWIDDSYSTLVPPDQRLPVVDPDLISPDDFRDPFGSAGTPFKTLWQTRRAWVDDLLTHFVQIVFGSAAVPQQPPADTLTRLFQDMRQSAYAGSSATFWPATAEDHLASLSIDLQDRLEPDKIAAATADLWTNFKLTPEMLVSLLALKTRHEAWSYDPSNPPLDQDGWTETINILVQAQKSQWATQWIADESAKNLLLGPNDFWISLSEPAEGDWPPPPLANDVPRIDPETVKPEDLPDPTAGALAIKLWNDRHAELQGVARDLAGFSRDLAGATRRIKEAFPDQDIATLEQEYADLTGSDPAKLAAATTFIQDTLRWATDPFRRVMELRAQLKAGQVPQPPKPTIAEWAEMEGLLVIAYKQYVAWTIWRQREDAAGLAYWDEIKARAPRWRAPAEARQAWQQALRARSAPAIIDPDLLRETHFRARRVNPALTLWRSRGQTVASFANGYQPSSKTKAALETLLEDALGPLASDGLPAGQDGLSVLLQDALNNNVISARLDQLVVSRPAMSFLARMHALLAQTPPQKLTASEWSDISAILTQVTKLRSTAAWREEERAQGLTQSPDWFKIPVFTTVTQFPPPSPPDPPTWRGTWSDVQNWEDALQSRIDQETTVIEAVRQAVGEVEADTLPSLRDALVTVAGQGSNLDTKAEWLTARLLIDAKQGGCALTTRIAQAIETLQQLLWGVRTGLLAVAYPRLALIPVNMKAEDAIEQFDQAWTWIGSYPAWRAAMFVFLYPENLLLPSLKRRQTPAFRQLCDDFRNADPITAANFATSLQRYYSYFNDVCQLGPPTCQATTSYVYEENELGADLAPSLMSRSVEHLFAMTPQGALYWSVVDQTTDDADWAQTYWRPLTGFKNDLVALVGCTAFKTAAGRRLLYLFAETTKDGADKLEFLRFDLDRGGWDSESTEIPIDSADSATSFAVQLEQVSDETQPPTLFLVYPDHRVRYTLGKTGGTDVGVTQTLGTTTNWSSPQPTNLGTLPTTQRDIELHKVSDWQQEYVSATSICPAQVQGQKCLLTFWAQITQLWLGGAFRFQRFCVASTITGGAIAWGDVAPLDPAPVESPSPVMSVISPVGFATADITGSGGAKTDVVWCYLRADASAGQMQYRVCFSIGWDLGSDGVPKGGWSLETKTDIFLSNPLVGNVNFVDWQNDLTNVTSNGLKCTVASLPGGTNYLVVAAVAKATTTTATPSAVRADLYVTQISSTGDVLGSPLTTIPGPSSTIDGIPTGVGVAYADLGSDTHLDAVVFYLMRPKTGGETSGQYFVGANCGTDFRPRDGWSAAQPVGGQTPWFGALTGGAAIAVADVNDANPQVPARADLIVFHDVYGGGNPGVGGFYRIGYDFGFEALPPPAQCTHDNFKPVAGQIPLSFFGFETLDLEIGNAIQATKTARNFVYVEEAFYFVPVLVALQLQSAGEFIAALDWFRLVYDYTLPVALRRLVGLAPQITIADFQRDDPAVQGDEYDWLLDPLNPHSIARTRRNTYLRYTQLSIIKCFLDYADSEFTNDTSESVPRARTLYRRALDLLGSDELKPASDTCEGVRGDLEITFADKWSDVLTDVIPHAAATSVGQMRALGASLGKVFSRYAGTDRLLAKAREAAAKLQPPRAAELRVGASVAQARAATAGVEAAFMSDAQFSARMQAVAGRFYPLQPGTGPSRNPSPAGDGAAQPPAPTKGARAPVANGALKDANGLGVRPWPGITLPPIDPMIVSFCVPQNPILQMLRLRANLNLYKIHTCRNISGIERELDPYAAPTDTETGLPSIGAGGQLQLPGTTSIHPTPYRYQTLIDRAKQLVQLAMQIEQAYLTALEKADAEEYAMLKARQDLNLSAAGVRLQELRVTEAQGGVTLAGLQRTRAGIQVVTYEQWMSAGLSELEQAAVGLYAVVASQQIIGSAMDLTIQAAQSTNLAAEIAGVIPGAASAAAAARSVQYTAEAAIKINEIYASQERRMQEWQLQKALAEQDVAIADQQIDLAEDNVRVTEQERTIAQMQHDNALQTVDFLAGKFTNKELYDWMSGVLERVYSFFLQQATAMAQLAQTQLAFERQQTPPSYIQSDYWQAQGSGSAAGPLSTTDQHGGLTGSARLTQDIYQLDQYAFETNKLKLQITKTISLAQLAPYEFQRFRETGILGFATPMELFDRDFPGHYLRLIKRVRTSVIALIPPSQGICATLSSTGLSQVVIGGDIFQTVSLRRDPETIALTSPINATGLFDLDIQQPADMLLPMEGTGVATTWEFRMLKSSNQFDFDSIADVLLTIDYTALNSFDYYAQIIQSPALNRPFSADRPYSFRQDFADAWYDLHNPDQSPTRMAVRFATSRDDFPPNLSNLKIQNVLLYVASSSDNVIDLQDVELKFTETGGGTVGGAASSADGVISTRRGNAGAWTAMIGKAPVGQWELRLPDSAGVRELLSIAPPDEQKSVDRVAELLLVITYSGRTPAWPT